MINPGDMRQMADAERLAFLSRGAQQMSEDQMAAWRERQMSGMQNAVRQLGQPPDMRKAPLWRRALHALRCRGFLRYVPVEHVIVCSRCGFHWAD